MSTESSSPASAALRAAPTRFARQSVNRHCGAPAQPDAPGPSLRRRSPLRFDRLLLASLGNPSIVTAVRQPSRTHRVPSLRRRSPLRFDRLLLASLDNPSGHAAVRRPSRTHRVLPLRRRPPLRFDRLLLASLDNPSGHAAVRRPSRTRRSSREHAGGNPGGRVPRHQLPATVAGHDRHRLLRAALLPGRHGPRPRLADRPERVVVRQPRRAQLRGLPRPGTAGRQRHDHRLARQHVAGARRDAVEPHLLRDDVDTAARGRRRRRSRPLDDVQGVRRRSAPSPR